MLNLNNFGSSELGPCGKNYFTVWLNGCQKKCKGCISAAMNESQPPFVVSPVLLAQIFSQKNYDGIILSGGEPFLQCDELVNFLETAEMLCGHHVNVICYTGNIWEQLRDECQKKLLARIDLLIDGEYIAELDTGNRYRGSDNQRMLFLSDVFSPDDFPPMQRSITVTFHNDNMLTMTGIPSASEAAVWKQIKEIFL